MNSWILIITIVLCVYFAFFSKTPGVVAGKILNGSDRKDPNDFSLTNASTNWGTYTHCGHCLSRTGHEEIMADICNSCGGFGRMSKYASSRKIWDGERWVIQTRYNNNSFELSDYSNYPEFK